MKNIIENTKLTDKEKIDLIAEQGITVTDACRVIYIDDELELEEEQVVTGLGHHWLDKHNNMQNEFGYEADEFGETAVYIHCDNIKGYKIPYFNEIYQEEHNLTDEELEAKQKEYEGLYDLVGTDAEYQRENELLVSNNQQFKVVDIFTPNEETDFYEVYVELV